MFIKPLLKCGTSETGVCLYPGVTVYHLSLVHYIGHQTFPIKGTGPGCRAKLIRDLFVPILIFIKIHVCIYACTKHKLITFSCVNRK